MSEKKKIAIIGAGPAGLVTANELKNAGVEFTLFEQRDCLGGTWAPQPLDKIPDLRDGLSNVYSATFPSLRTNFPRALMTLPNHSYPDNTPIYPTHQEVLSHLESFAKNNQIIEHIQFGYQFVSLEPLETSDSNQRKWKVITIPSQDDLFDGVVFCNSRYSVPLFPDIEGLSTFSGKVEHSLSYRGPEHYRGLRVVLLGTGPSGEDLSREISLEAERVFLCARKNSREHLKAEEGLYGPQHNISRQSNILSCQNHSLVLENGDTLDNIDVLILCTGYKASSVLLSSLPGTRMSGNGLSIAPLYLNLFHCQYPELAVTGMEVGSFPFPLYKYQAKVIAKVLAGQLALPSSKQRLFAAEQCELREKGGFNLAARRREAIKKHTLLSRLAGTELPDRALYELAEKGNKHRKQFPYTYRDQPW